MINMTFVRLKPFEEVATNPFEIYGIQKKTYEVLASETQIVRGIDEEFDCVVINTRDGVPFYIPMSCVEFIDD